MFEPKLVGSVADNLIRASDDIDVGEWEACEEARTRSAASRGYYAVLLAIKRRVVVRDSSFAFPKRRVHAVVRKAVGRALGVGSPIRQALTVLVDAREHADYDLEGRVSHRTAEELVDRAIDAVELIAELDDAAIDRIASKIVAVEQEMQSQSS